MSVSTSSGFTAFQAPSKSNVVVALASTSSRVSAPSDASVAVDHDDVLEPLSWRP